MKRLIPTLFVLMLAIIATAKEPAKEIALDLGSGATLEMVLIPAGEFKMGDDQRNARGAATFGDSSGRHSGRRA